MCADPSIIHRQLNSYLSASLGVSIHSSRVRWATPNARKTHWRALASLSPLVCMARLLVQSIIQARIAWIVVAMALVFSPWAAAQGLGKSVIHDGTAKATDPQTEFFDKLWSLPVVYKNDANPFIEQFSFIGRYQGQYFSVDSNLKDDDDYENRRFRLGFKMLMLNKKLSITAEVQTNDLFSPVYDNLTDVFAEYKPDAHWQFRIGKWQPHFGYEFGVTSREIITFERGALVNQMGIFFTPGARVGYTHGKWTAMLAGFSNESDREFGNFGGGFSSMLSIVYDVYKDWSLDAGDLRVDWLHSDSGPNDNRLNFFTDSVSLNWRLKEGHLNFYGDLIGASGPRGDAFGLTLMPTWMITPKLELITRYQFSVGDESDVLRALQRYERLAGGTTGDLYQAAYLGMNYYVYGQRFKLMAGVEYATLSGGKQDFRSWTLLSGVRVYF